MVEWKANGGGGAGAGEGGFGAEESKMLPMMKACSPYDSQHACKPEALKDDSLGKRKLAACSIQILEESAPAETPIHLPCTVFRRIRVFEMSALISPQKAF